ncbi:MAG: hypothetical protein AVDCRST_MAG88-984, partial [uncultured Thermomicrobiales bacterium]
ADPRDSRLRARRSRLRRGRPAHKAPPAGCRASLHPGARLRDARRRVLRGAAGSQPRASEHPHLPQRRATQGRRGGQGGERGRAPGVRATAHRGAGGRGERGVRLLLRPGRGGGAALGFGARRGLPVPLPRPVPGGGGRDRRRFLRHFSGRDRAIGDSRCARGPRRLRRRLRQPEDDRGARCARRVFRHGGPRPHRRGRARGDRERRHLRGGGGRVGLRAGEQRLAQGGRQ